MKRADPEHQIQCAFIEWCRWNEKKYPMLKLGFSVPNGGGRSRADAGRLKAEGVRPGVPDWEFPFPNQNFAGLAIEFKAPGRHPTQAQLDYHALLQKADWLVVVTADVTLAVSVTQEYLDNIDYRDFARWTRQESGVIVPSKSMAHGHRNDRAA